MKKILYIFSIVFCVGCQDVIDVDLDNTDPRLVIDAYFNVYNARSSFFVNAQGGVQLSLSAPYFDEEIPTVSDATVYITDLSNNTVINFSENTTNPGLFVPSNGFFPEFSKDYELTVEYNNNTYNASTQMIPTVAIDSVVKVDSNLFDRTEVKVYYTDPELSDDFYLFDMDFNLFGVSEDKFYQGQSFGFPYFYEDDEFDAQQEINIKILGIDEDYYNFFNLVLEQNENDGSPFQTPPALIKGNIINTTDSDNFPFGFFRISEVYESSIMIEE